MSGPLPGRVVEVAAAVLLQADGRFLLGRRPPGTFYPGYWEFPGGKVEPGEGPKDALVRELREELGIEVRSCYPWLVREFVYPHAHVRLNFFRVTAWSGELRDHSHTELAWQTPAAAIVEPMLPANAPVLKALRLPDLYGITHAAEIGAERQLEALAAALTKGLRLVQIREQGLAPGARRDFARRVVALARRAGATVLVNGDIGLAEELAADGVHLRAAQLATLDRRPAFEWVGASCHNRPELERAVSLGADFAVLGPVQPTSSHPGAAALGWAGFDAVARGGSIPIYAIGGLSPGHLEAAWCHGGHGIAAIRAAWTHR